MCERCVKGAGRLSLCSNQFSVHTRGLSNFKKKKKSWTFDVPQAVDTWAHGGLPNHHLLLSLVCRLLAEAEAARARCVRGLSLRALSQEPSMAASQVLLCCQRLAEQPPLPHLRGLHIRVSRFYSVLQDGELCIPWDWEP